MAGGCGGTRPRGRGRGRGWGRRVASTRVWRELELGLGHHRVKTLLLLVTRIFRGVCHLGEVQLFAVSAFGFFYGEKGLRRGVAALF